MSKKDVHTVPSANGNGWVNKVSGEVGHIDAVTGGASIPLLLAKR